MKTVKIPLSAAQQDDVSAAPGETLTDKLRWIVGYWGAVLEQHRARVAKEAAEKAKSAQLALVKSAADAAVRDMSTGEQQGAENVVAAVGGMDGIMRKFAERKGAGY